MQLNLGLHARLDLYSCCCPVLDTPGCPECPPQKGIQVINSARQGSVTGSLVGSTGSGAGSSSNSLFEGSFGIVAFPNEGSDPTSASKLSVGPSFLAGLYSAGVKQAFGPYWVVAAGETVTQLSHLLLLRLVFGCGGVLTLTDRCITNCVMQQPCNSRGLPDCMQWGSLCCDLAGPSADGSNYDWAIVSGGPPRTNTGAGCAAGPLNPTIFDVNGAGRSYLSAASAKVH
jgi:hypothetical protein